MDNGVGVTLALRHRLPGDPSGSFSVGVVGVGRPERPVDPGEGPVAQFAVGLREVRRVAGDPTYRELAQRAHYSVATLAMAAGGKRFPSLPVTLAFVRACDGDTGEWERRWRDTSAELDGPQPDSPEAGDTVDGGSGGRSPYVGLATYGPEDAEWFRGRDSVVAGLVEQVHSERFVAVVGASGAGKSSVLRAGLLPAITADRRWQTLLVTPGAHPLQELAVQLAGRLELPAGQLATNLAEHPENLGLAVRQLVADDRDDAEFVLVVDQFEEIFTLCHDDLEREQFIAALWEAATAPGSRTRVVVGLRSDFYTHCARHPRLVQVLRDGQVLVGPMTTEELVEAITQPAVRAGLILEKTLVTTVVHDAEQRAGALPFVSHALWETWRRRHGKGLFLTGYQAAGGVNGAIAKTADRLYSGLDEGQQRIAQDVFLRLTALGEGTEDTRRRVSRKELLDSPHRDAVTAVLDKLAAARLVRLDADTVEIAHEALIRGWPTLQEWLTEDRETLRAHRGLTEAAAEWERHERDESLLYRGARLTAWQDRPQDRCNDAERTFLTASRRAAERVRRLRRRRVRWTIGGLCAATVIVTVLAVFAFVMAVRADNERSLAVSRQLVADARAQLQADPELGLLLAREAFTRAPNDDTEAVLRQATADSHLRATLSANTESWYPNVPAVTGAAFSPDGKHVVTSDMGGALQVWDWKAGKVARGLPRMPNNDHSLNSPVFSPDGSHILAAGSGGGVSVRDWAGGGKPAPFQEGANWRQPPPFDPEDMVLDVAFSTDVRRLASSQESGTIRIWNAVGDGQPDVLRGHDGPVRGVAFSPDGQRLASSGDDGTVRVWDLVNGGSPVVQRGLEGSVWSVAFSANGRHIVTGGTDGAIRVWDPTGMTGPVVLGNHNDRVYGVTYSADGHSIASAGGDGTIRIWNADHHAEPVVLRGHRGAITAVAFSPDGKTVVSASNDGTAKVWTVDEVEDVTVLRGHHGLASPWWPVRGYHGLATSAAASPDGRRVASGGQDGTIRIWDTTGNSEPVMLRGLPAIQVALSPDGHHLATVNGDGTVFVWNTREPTEPARLRTQFGQPVSQVAFSPDSKRLAAATLDDALSIWTTPEAGHTEQSQPEQLSAPRRWLHDVVWSPDGHHVAAASDNTEARQRRARPAPARRALMR